MATDPHNTVTQEIPVEGGASMRDVAVASIVSSRTNPRKTFDAAKLQELADSITASGVHQPILLRPLPAERLQDTFANRTKGQPLPEYEIVAGERRWRASQLAGKAMIPAMIRPLTDAQALEVQIIENLQREDVSELEEAEGYQALMEAQGINAEAVGAKIGKSRGYVFARLKLLDLCSTARDALREGKIDYSVALTIARIPAEQLQLQALEFATDENYEGATPSARTVQAHARRYFMLKLKDAPFDRKDETLCTKAGACTACSKRTGANPDLFADVDSADVCTDPPCYHNKEDLFAARVRQAAQDQGLDVIDGREAKALMPSVYSGEVQGFLRLDTDRDIPIKGKPLRKIVAKAMELTGIKPTMIVNPHNSKELIAVLRPEQAQELLQIAGATEQREKLQEEAAQAAKEDQRAEEDKAKQAYESKWRVELATKIIKMIDEDPAAVTMPRTIHEVLCRQQINTMDADSVRKLCLLLDLGKVAPSQALTDWANQHDYPDAALLVLMTWKDRVHRNWSTNAYNEVLICMAGDRGIDVRGFQNSIKANLRAAKATQKQQQAKKAAQESQATDSLAAPAPASTPTPAAQAQKGRGGKKGAKAQASEAPKTSAAFALSQIAEAMQAAETPADAASALDAGQEDIPGAAEAAQSNDAQAVAVAQPATALDSRAWPFPPQQPKPAALTASGKRTPVAEPAPAPVPTPAFNTGDKVRIKAGAQIAAKHDKLRAEVGELRYQVGSKANTWRVAFPAVVLRGQPVVESFKVTDLELAND